MKKFFKLMASFFLLWVSFTGCSNFLNGSDLKKNIDEEILKANARDCSFYLKCDENTGSFLFDGLLKVKQGYAYEKELQFFLNKNLYRFSNWQVYDNKGMEISDFIEFTDTSTLDDKDRGIYKAKITALKFFEDFTVKPKCQIIPDVVSANIENAFISYPQDTTLRISFNTEIFSEYFTDSSGNFKNLSIKNSNTNKNLEPYYETPFVDSDNKTLIIPAVKGMFIIEDKNKDKTESISLFLELTNLKDEKGNSIFEKNISYNFTVTGSVDNKKPSVTSDLKVSSFGEIALSSENELAIDTSFDVYSQENDAARLAQNIERNYAQDSVYFAVGLEDDGIGLEKILVEEKLIYSSYTNNYSTSLTPVDDATFEFKEYYLGGVKEINFDSVYDFQIPDTGIIQLKFKAYDYSGNETVLGTYEFIKNSTPLEVSIYQADTDGLYTDTKKNVTYYMYIQNSIYFIDKNEKNYSNSTWSPEEAEALDYKFNVSVSDVQFSTDGINWQSGNNLNNYYCFYNEKFYEICATVDWEKDSSKDLYIKTIVKDKKGNLHTATESIQKTPKILNMVTSENILYPIFETQPEDNFFVVYRNSPEEDFYLCGGPSSDRRYSASITNQILYPAPENLVSGTTEFFVLPAKKSSTNYKTSFPLSAKDTIKESYATLYKIGQTDNPETVTYYPLTGSLGTPFVYNSDNSAPDETVVPSLEQIRIQISPDGINTGTATVKISFDESFEKNENYSYYYKYKQRSDENYLFSDSAEFKIKSQISYDIGIYAVSKTGQSVSSEEQSVISTYDNYQPGLKDAVVINEYPNKVTLSVVKTNTTAPEPAAVKNSLTYFFTNSPSTDFTDEEIKNLNVQKNESKQQASGYFDFYYNNMTSKYLYVKAEDENSNFRYIYFQIGARDNLSNDKIQLVNYTENKFDFNVLNKKDEETKFLISSEQNSIKNTTYILEKFDSTAKEWITADKTKLVTNKFSCELDKSENENCFLRIISYINSSDAASINRFNYTSYLYPAYTLNEKKSCGIKNLVEGAGGISVLCSDETFIHTMYCQTNFGDNIDSWETKAIETGCVQFSESDNYEIPLNEIPEGFYYTVAAHFADGTTVCTQPKLMTK